MTIKTRFKGGNFLPLKEVKEIKEGDIVEIEIKPKKRLSWRGAMKHIKKSSVELQHMIKEVW